MTTREPPARRAHLGRTALIVAALLVVGCVAHFVRDRSLRVARQAELLQEAQEQMAQARASAEAARLRVK